MEPKTKIYCAGEDQQQFNQLTDQPKLVSRELEVGVGHQQF
jgi:hypothetical protein